MAFIYDILRRYTDKSGKEQIKDQTKKAYSDKFNPFTGSDYYMSMDENIKAFAGANVAEGLAKNSINSYSNYSVSRVLSSQNSWNKVQSIMDKKQGTLWAFDSETLGDIGREFSPNNELMSYATITEIGIAKNEFNPDGTMTPRNQSIAFGISEDQATALRFLLEDAKKNGLNFADDTKEVRGIKFSTLERLSRYGADDVFKLDTVQELNNAQAYVINHLADSSVYNFDQIEKGINNLEALGKHQRINSGYGKKLFQEVTSFMSNIQNSDQDAFLGYNFDYDIRTIQNAGRSIGSNVNINPEGVADLYYANEVIAKGSPLDNLKDISRAFRRPAFAHPRPTSLEGIAGAMGISFQAHNAGEDSAISLELITSKLFKHNKNFLQNLDVAKADAISDADSIAKYSLTKEGNLTTVLRANRSLLFNKNDVEFIIRDGKPVNKSTVYGINSDKFYKINSIKKLQDGRFGVEFSSAAKKEDLQYMRVYDSEKSMFDSLEQDFTPMVTSNRKYPKQIGNKAYISQTNINRENAIIEADQARRDYDRFFDASSVQIDDGKEVGGFAAWEENYKWFDEINQKLSVSDMTGKQLRSFEKDLRDGKYRSELGEVIGENQYTKIRNFENMYGRLADEQSLFKVVSSVIYDKKEYNVSLSNRQKTFIANKMMREVDGVLENGYVDDIAKRISRSVSLSDNLFKHGSVSDMYAMDIFNALEADNPKKMYTRIDISDPEKIGANIYNALKKSAKKMKGVGSTDQALNSLLYEAVKKMQDDEIFGDSYIDIIKGLSENSANTNPWFVANEIGNRISESYIKPLSRLGYSIDDYINEKETGNEALDRFLMSKTKRTMGQRSLTMQGSKVNVYEDGKKSIMSIGEAVAKTPSLMEDLMMVGNSAKKDIVLNSSFDLLSSQEKIEQALMDNLNYSKENANTVWRSIGVKRKGGTPYGLATFEDADKNSEFFTAFVAPNTPGNSAYIVATKRKNQERIISVLSDNSMSIDERLNIIKGEDSPSSQAFGSVFEIKALRKRQYGTGDKIGQGVMGSVTQGERDFERIINNNLNLWQKEDGLSGMELTISNTMDDINSVYRMVNKRIADDLMDDNYTGATNRYKKAVNKIMKDMPGFSGIQTIIGEDGMIQKSIVPNVADVLQSSTVNLSPLKQMVAMVAAETGDEDLSKVLGMFAPKNQTDPTAMRELYNSIKNKEFVDPNFNEYFAKHLFSMDFNEEQGNYHINTVRTDGMKNTFIQKLYDYRDKFSDQTRKTISDIYDNREEYSQILKEGQVADTEASFVNKLLYNDFAIFDATSRPTNLQQLTGRQSFSIRDDMNTFKEVFDGNNVKVGTSITTKQRLDLIANAVDNDQWKVKGLDKTIADAENYITGDVRQMTDLDIAKAYRNHDIAKQIAQYSAGDKAFDSDLYEYTFGLMKDQMNSVYESKSIIRPSVANLDMFRSPDLYTFHNSNIKNLSPQGKEKLRDLIEQQDFKLTNGMLLGVVESENGTKKIFYNGPEGKVTDIEALVNGDATYVLPEMRAIRDAKIMFGNEKTTGNLMLFDKDSDLFSKYIVYDKFGDVDEVASIKKFNKYTDLVFNDIFGKNVMAASNFEIYKHASGGLVFGSYINQIAEAFSGQSRRREFQDLMKEAGLGDLDFSYRIIKDASGRTIRSQWQYDMSKAAAGGYMEGVEKAVDIIKERGNLGDEFYKNLYSSIEEKRENNIIRTSMQKAINNESMGKRFVLDYRAEQQVRMTGLEDGVTSGNTIMDMITDPIMKSERYQNALKSVEGILFSLDHRENPDRVKSFSNVVTVDFDEINLPKSGADIEDLRNGIFKINGRPSDLLRIAAEREGLSNVDNINSVIINLKKSGSAGALVGKNNKEIKSIIVPVLDVMPNEGEVVYSEAEKSIVGFLNKFKDYDGRNRSGLWDAYENMNLSLAGELTGKTGSYMYENIIRKELPFSGQVFAKSTDAPLLEEMFSDQWSDKNYRKAIADQIRRGEVGPQLYDHPESFVRNMDGSVTYKNVSRVSKEVFEDLGFDFVESGKNLVDDVLRNDGYIMEHMVDEADEFGISTGRMYANLDNTLKSQLMDVEFHGLDRFATSTKEIMDQINNLYNKNIDSMITKEMAKTSEGINLAEAELKIKEFLDNEGKVTDQAQYDFWVKMKETELDKYKSLAASKRRELALEKDIWKNQINRVFEDISTDYLEKVGVYGFDVRYPTFNEGSILLDKLILDSKLQGRQIISAPWKALLQKLDHDGDTLFLSLFLKQNQHSKKGVLYNTLYDADMTSALDDYYEYTNQRNAGILAGAVEEYTGTANSLTDMRRYKIELIKRYAPEKLQDLDQGVDYILKNYDSYKGVIASFDKDFGNQLKNTQATLTAIKNKANKGDIGYFSNVNYKVRDVIFELSQSLTGDKLDELYAIKKDLSSGIEGLLWFTEQKGIDTKHETGSDFISDTADWKAGVNNLFRAETVANKEAALGQMYEAVKYKLFTDDLTGTIEEQTANKSNTIKRILDANVVYDELAKTAANGKDPRAEAWFRSMLSLSDMKEAKTAFAKVIGDKNIKDLNQLNELMLETKSIMSTDLSDAPNSLTNQIYKAIQNIFDYSEIGLYDGRKTHALDKETIYFTNDYEYGPVGYSLKDLNTRKGITTAVFEARDLETGNVITKKGVLKYNIKPNITFKGQTKSVNEQINKMFSFENKAQISEWMRNEDLRNSKIATLSDNGAKYFVDQGTRRLDLFQGFKDGILPEHVKSKAHIQAFENARAKYFSFVDKNVVEEFSNQMAYIKSRGFTDANGKRLLQGEAFGTVLDNLNKQIIERGKDHYNNGKIFKDSVDYYVKQAANQVIDFNSEDYQIFKNGLSGKALDATGLINDARFEIESKLFDVDAIEKDLHKRFDQIIQSSFKDKEYSQNNLESHNRLVRDIVNKHKDQNLRIIKSAEASVYGEALDLNKLNKVFNWGTDVKNARIGFGKYIGMNISDLGSENIAEIMAASTEDRGLSVAKRYAIQQTKLHINKYQKESNPFADANVKVGVALMDRSIAGDSLSRLNAKLIERASNNKASAYSTKAGQEQAREAAKEASDGMKAKKIDPDDFVGQAKQGLHGLKGKIGKGIMAMAAIGMASQLIMQHTQQSPLVPDRKQNGTIPNSLGSYDAPQPTQAPPTSMKKKTVYVDNQSGNHFRMSAKSASNISQMDAADKIGREMGGAGSVDIHTYDDRSKVSNNWLEQQFAQLM